MFFKNLVIILILFTFSIQELNISQNVTIADLIENDSSFRKLFENFGEIQENTGSLFLFVMDLVQFVYSYLNRNNLTIMLHPSISKCVYRGIIEQLGNKKMLQTCIRGSGKALNDFGNEFECENTLESRVQYFTLQFYLNDSSTISSKESQNILDFLEQHYFYLGLCLPKDCKDAVNFLANDNHTLRVIHSKGDLSNFKAYYKDDIIEMSNKTRPVFSYTIYMYFGINLLKIIIGTIRVIAMNKGYIGCFTNMELKKNKKSNENKNKDKLLNKDKNEKSEENDKINTEKNEEKKQNSSLLAMQFNEKNDDISSFYNHTVGGNLLSDDINIYNPFIDKEKKYPIYLKIMKIFDFYDNVSTLSVFSNKYYNSFQIKRLYFIRFIIMIMSIVYQLVYSQMELPYRYYIKNSFYQDFKFTFIKLCINASTFWITLDAVIIGYKLMCFIKKEIILSKYRRIGILNISKFLLLIIPKFVVFFFAFVYLHIFGSNLTFELCKKNQVFSSYLYYRDTIQKRSYSIRQANDSFYRIFTNFVPFRLNYIDFYENVTSQKNIEVIDENGTDDNYAKSFQFDPSGYELPSPFLTNTDLFVNVYFNETYLLIIMIIVTYISYKLRNKIFDYIILGINIILFFLPLLDLNKHQEKDKKNLFYTLRYVLGQNYSEKYTHYFVNFFYFGFLIGVMKFYHDENLLQNHKKDISTEQINMPFEFCKYIIIAINKLKLRFKRTILLISFIILILISSSFFILQKEEDQENNFILRKGMDNIIYYLFLYEKNLCGFFFFIFLIMFVVYPKSANVIKLAERDGFILLERISFCFYCSFCYLIYAQFCIFIIYFQTSYMNLFLNTLGMLLITFTFSLFNTTLIELPLRQLIKSFMNRNFEDKFEKYYIKYKSRENSNNLNNSARSI